METKIVNSSTLTYEVDGEKESIVVKDNSDNQDWIDIQMGECRVSVPKAVIYELRLVLSKYE